MKDRIARLWGKIRGIRPLGATAMTLSVGTMVDGRFRIKGLIGIGGTSAVYVAEQISMGRDVALKVLRSELLSREQATERFVREVRAISRLTSPHTISVYDVGRTEDGLLYIAMELLKGRSLFRLMTEEPGPMSPWRAVNLVSQVLNSLGEAHQAGVLHRDLKPENIFIIPGAGRTEFVKVLDFGIAQLGDDAPMRESERSIVVGTPRYMSPEQMEGKPLDPRSDLYSLATILFELLAGVPPFEAPTPVALALRKIREDPPRIRDLVPGVRVPKELEDFLVRALARDPDKRPKDASEFQNLMLIAMEGFREEGPPEQERLSESGEVPSAREVEEPRPSLEEPKKVPGDRREAPRIMRMMGVTFQYKGRECRATTTDISVSGAFFFSREIPEVGDRIEFVFDSVSQGPFKYHLIGEVVRTVQRPEGPGQVRGFAVKWVFSEGARRPKTVDELFASGY